MSLLHRCCSLYNYAAVVTVLCTILAVSLPVNGQQCLVSAPTIVSSSSSDDICAVVSQGTLRYICNNDNVALVWTSSVFSTPITVVASVDTGTLSMPATGVTLVENGNDNAMCLNSTLTFTGTVADLEQLNGVVLTCVDSANASLTDNVTIVIPVLAGPPTSMNAASICGGSGNQVTLQWTPPTNTGGQGVVITHYNITGLPQSASCSTGPCDMVVGTATTITGLQCNDDSTVTVSAVNCRGVGNASDPIMITVDIPDFAAPTFSETPCFDGDNIRVSLMEYTNSCLSNLMFVVSSNCSASEQVVMVSQTSVTVKMLPASADDDCEVTAFVRSDCGDSSGPKIMVNGTCSMLPIPTPSPSGVSPTATPTAAPSNVLTITEACLVGNSVSVQWMPPSSDGSTSLCTKIQNYSLVISNSTGILVTMTTESQTRSVSVSVTSSDYYNISLTANSVCSGNLTTSVTTDIASTACVDSITGCQVGLSVGIPVTFLLTAIISSLLTLLITYLCLIMRERSHSKFTPQQLQGEPVYDPVSAVSGTRPTAAVEMKSNVAYGTTAAATAASGNITYETVLQPQ